MDNLLEVAKQAKIDYDEMKHRLDRCMSELIDVKQEVKGTRELGMTRELELKNLKAAVMDFIQARKLDLDDSAMITLKESLK